jgi:hypothetical protein
MQRQIRNRIQKLEQRLAAAVKALSRTSPKCICFPEGTVPFVSFEIEEDIAFLVKCPLHGDRFRRTEFWMFKPVWLSEKTAIWVGRQSAQYQKAYAASFPADLWPAVGEVVNGVPCLRLKDGTRLDMHGRWTSPHAPAIQQEVGPPAEPIGENRGKANGELEKKNRNAEEEVLSPRIDASDCLFAGRTENEFGRRPLPLPAAIDSRSRLRPNA